MTSPKTRAVALAAGRTAKRLHPAQRTRIAVAGLSASTMLGLVGAMGYRAAIEPSASSPAGAAAAQPSAMVVVPPAGASDPNSLTVAPAPAGSTTLRARPTVRPTSPQAQAPAASTRGSG